MNQISVGSNCIVRHVAHLEVANRPGEPKGHITLGNRVTMEQGAHLAACGEVVLEGDVCLAPRCTILDATHPATSDYETSPSP